MKNLLWLLAHLLTTVARHLGPGGANAVIAENLLLKQQLLVISRARRRAPNITALDRFLFACGHCLLINADSQRLPLLSNLRRF